MPKAAKITSKVYYLFCVIVICLTTTVLFSKNSYADSSPLSQTDMALLRSLQPKMDTTTITIAPNSNGDITKNITLSNSSKVAAALQQKNLSPQMKQALTNLVTEITITAKVPTQTSLAQSSASLCATATGSITGKNALSLNEFYYLVSQPFCGNGSVITSYGSRRFLDAIDFPGWSFGGDSSSLPNPSTGVASVIEYNTGIFNNAPPAIGINLATANAHINLYMFGGGYWDVNVYID